MKRDITLKGEQTKHFPKTERQREGICVWSVWPVWGLAWRGGTLFSGNSSETERETERREKFFFIPLSSSSNLHASASPLLPHPLPTTPIIFSTLLHYFHYFHFHAISRFCVVFLIYAFKITPPRLSFLFFFFVFVPFWSDKEGSRKKKKKKARNGCFLRIHSAFQDPEKALSSLEGPKCMQFLLLNFP